MLFRLLSPLLFLLPLSLFFLTLLSFCSNLLFAYLVRQLAVPSALLLVLKPPLFCCRQPGFAAVSVVLLPSAWFFCRRRGFLLLAWFAAVGVVLLPWGWFCCGWGDFAAVGVVLLRSGWFCCCWGGFAAVGVVLLLLVWFCCCQCGFAAVSVVLLPSALVLQLLVLELLYAFFGDSVFIVFAAVVFLFLLALLLPFFLPCHFFADPIIVGTGVAFFDIAVVLFLALQLPLFSLTLSFFLSVSSLLVLPWLLVAMLLWYLIMTY